MSNIYSPEAQKSIDAAEGALGDAISQLKSQPKNENTEIEIVTEATPDVEVAIDTPAKEPRRTEFVKTDDPKVQERINDLYRQVKGSDARNQMILEHNRLMEEKLAEYQEKLSKFEQATKNAASEKVESELRAALRSAREESDFDRVDEIESKLHLIREEKLKSSLIPEKTQPRVNPQQQQIDQHVVHTAKYLEFAANEKDGSGNLVRPYLYDWHPDNQKAVDLFTSIPKEFAAAGKQADIKTIIEVMDERLHGKKTPVTRSVLGGDGNDAPVRNSIKLTALEAEIAKKMGLDLKDYARQKQLINS